MMPLRSGPTPFLAFSPIWWQALQTPKTFSPAAASWARTSPEQATASSATTIRLRILFSLFRVRPFPARTVGFVDLPDRGVSGVERPAVSNAVDVQTSINGHQSHLHAWPHGRDVADSRCRHQAEGGRKRIRLGGGRRNDADGAIERGTASRPGIE